MDIARLSYLEMYGFGSLYAVRSFLVFHSSNNTNSAFLRSMLRNAYLVKICVRGITV